ncbi:Cyclin-dependent kinase-like 4 [Coemansia guatemalensis]|uniref:Cyclin-dependent kinase-like 4 n=1 Tax=Coemansia guatemalensis TaxID=2761395 RepID=A0A9W8LW79_9FUNG|nr:Cyclin-dependent kinase-like 4 [Coemansia guatemalensis]
MDLTHDPSDQIMAKARILNTRIGSPSALEIAKRIPHQIYARHRSAYLFDTEHSIHGRVVLKLSWTPIDRLPEGAVYDLLASTDIENIPKIYDRGLLKDNFFGHRLEYLVIEHCGIPIDKHFEDIRTQDNSSTRAEKETEWILPQVASCLIQALGHGILHRDMSLGNITLCKGQVKVIDWGYAKVLGTTDLDIDKIAIRWHFDKEMVLENEAKHDPLTGTWPYMSIQVLFGSPKRDIMDDLESLFYVFLDALWRLYSSSSSDYTSPDPRLGFQFHDKKSLAATRAGILGSKAKYPQFFGFNSCCRNIPDILDALYECLFYSDDRYIGPILVHDPHYKRAIDNRLASKFLNAAAIATLDKYQGIGNTESTDLPDVSNVQAHTLADTATEDKVANRTAANDVNGNIETV